ncbi:DUF6418 domain-containing protein [Sphingomonas sp. IC4-52]|uniref:DUF6418 domain-containing protein n=1 Tax=Sphingomonas sp. IC4-52 TaxID=2887202 RepID=UPI001D11DD56|nr:DUF6418 domain-containing protein [Sphingomonas sp. IC4-52]MCC2980800.1 DUF6418 domain-containing protein [Sphingomonas sp. IC4-52]
MIVLIYFLLFVGALIETISTSPVWSYLALLLFIAFVATLYRRRRGGIAILLPLIITRLLLLSSLIFIAQGFFIRELGVAGNSTTHACYFALLSCAFLHLATSTYRLLARTIIAKPTLTYPIARHLFVAGTITLAVGAVVYLLITGARDGFALFDATDRFEYRSNQGWLFNVIITFKPILCASLGFVRFRMKPPRIACGLASWSFAGLVLSSALFGDKFLSLLVMITYFFVPFIVLNGTLSRRARVVSTTVVLVAGTMTSGLTYYTYSNYGNLGVDATSERLFGRFTGQGQLWYAVNSLEADPTVGDPAEAQRLRAVMLATRDADVLAFDTHTGIFQMVERFAAPNIRSAVFDAKGLVQFTGAGEAYLAMVFGHAGMIFFMVLLAICCGVAVYYVYNSLISGSMVGFAFSIFIVSNYYTMLNQGSFWQIFGIRSLLYIAGMVAIDIVTRIVQSRSPRSLRGRLPSTLSDGPRAQ